MDIFDFPLEVLFYILKYNDFSNLLNFRMTCHRTNYTFIDNLSFLMKLIKPPKDFHEYYAFFGKLNELKFYAQTHNCPLTCTAAALNGQNKIIKFGFDKLNCAKEPVLCSNAALYGQLETIKYLIKRDVYPNWMTYFHLAKKNYVHILRWLDDNKYDIDINTVLKTAIDYNSLNVLNWINNKQMTKYLRSNKSFISFVHKPQLQRIIKRIRNERTLKMVLKGSRKEISLHEIINRDYNDREIIFGSLIKSGSSGYASAISQLGAICIGVIGIGAKPNVIINPNQLPSRFCMD